VPNPDRKCDHCYHETFDADKQRLGLGGAAFAHFWDAIEKNLDEDPANVYVTELPDSEGFRVYPTAPAHPDIPACVVYFSVEADSGITRINYFGLDPIQDEWVFEALDP